MNPVFIVAPVRSGSTFLRLMLDSHPEISNPGECDFLFDLITDDGDFPVLEKYINWLDINRIFKAKHLVVDLNLSYLKLVSSFVFQLQGDYPVLTMNVHRNFPRIPFVFPTARYIHLLRDPRDVARSCIGMGWVGNVYYGVDIWKEAELSWEQLKQGLQAEQYLEIKYEELVENVSSVLTTICSFLNLEYTDQMMDYAKNSSYSLPDKSLSYQWKNKQSKRELQLIEGKVDSMMKERGYVESGYGSVVPGWMERVALLLQSKKHSVSSQITDYGLVLFFQAYFARKLKIETFLKACQKKKNKIDIKKLK